MVTLGIGYLTDLVSRKTLFTWVIVLGEIPCLLTGFVQNYHQLFWLRAATGIAIGGALPLTFSLIGDYFSHRNRAAAAAYITTAQGLGIAVGQLLAGFLGPAYGWRIPFIIVGIPNFFFILLFWLTVKEPPRGNTEDALKDLIETGHAYTARIKWSIYRELFKNKTNFLVFISGIPGNIPWGILFVYLNDFYAQEKGFSVEAATLIIMAIGAGCITGGFVGGLVGNRIYNWSPKHLPLFCGISILLGILPTAYVLNYPSQAGLANPDFMGPVIIGFVAGVIMTFTTPNVRAMLLNVNAPETRGSIFALYNLSDDLGKGFGPAVISLFIVAFGRLVAFNISILFWVLCGALYLVMVITFPRDEEALNKLLAERAKEMK
jgi:predicted MFS family arabinose efflux permease